MSVDVNTSGSLNHTIIKAINEQSLDFRRYLISRGIDTIKTYCENNSNLTMEQVIAHYGDDYVYACE